MNPERWELVKALHARARKLTRAQARELLREECGGDAELVASVEALLDAEGSIEGFLETPPFDLHGDPTSESSPQRLGGFELYQRIGRGGFGVVYRARELALDRIVAVKVLPPKLTLQERDVERFKREARAIARLSHPNIVKVHSVGSEGEVHYFSMELVDGRDLGRELSLRDHDPESSRLPADDGEYLRTVARLVAEGADALQHAHEHGIVHRDVKPGNLLLDAAGHVQVVDFGLALDERMGRLTRTGEHAGTPHYMSPEQIESERHEVDHRTDVYSLGVVLYELLTLRKPFPSGKYLEVISDVIRKQPTAPRKLRPGLPRDLETICMKAMAKAVADRYPDAAALRDDLRRWLAGRPIVARPFSPLELGWRWSVRNRRGVAAAVALVLALGAAVTLTRRLERRAELAEVREGLQGLLREDDLAGLPFGELLAGRRALVRLRTDLGAQALTDAERELGQGFEQLRRSWHEQGLADLALSRERGRPDGERELARLRGLRTLMNAALLFPEDSELQQLGSIENALPTLSVRATDQAGAAIAAEVSLRAIDLNLGVPGRRRALGPAPLEGYPVEPGHYRVLVEFAAGGHRELGRVLGPASMDVELTVVRRDDEESIAESGHGMARFPSVGFTYPTTEGEFDPRQGRRVQLAGFLLDRCEVTNGEYKRFLAANPEQRPSRYWTHWPNWRTDTSLDELPVVGITWYEARAYAEWAGKRLPTAAEWQLAARGQEGRLVPWIAGASDEPLRGNVFVDLDVQGESEADNWAMYTRHASEVTSHPDARTPEGVYHMYGNVDEYTETVMLDVWGDELVPRTWDRLCYGGAWNAVRTGWSVARTNYVGIGPLYEIHVRGFRCARSLEP